MSDFLTPSQSQPMHFIMDNRQSEGSSSCGLPSGNHPSVSLGGGSNKR